MTVIDFPGGKPPPERKKSSRKVVQPELPISKLLLGPIHYTCPMCANKTVIHGENLIFRQFDFYCSSCGQLHRMVNPAFSTGTRRPPNQP